MGGNQTGIFDELKGAIEEILEEMSDYRVAFAAEDGEDDGEAEKETPMERVRVAGADQRGQGAVYVPSLREKRI